MTDGILLNEMQHDRTLSRYDTIIIDEAHERSLNIDFILGYLKQLLPRRPDLKVNHLGDHRPGALRPALRRRTGRRRPSSRSRPHLPGRGALPTARRPRSGGPGSAATRPGAERDQVTGCEAVEEPGPRTARSILGLPVGRARDP